MDDFKKKLEEEQLHRLMEQNKLVSKHAVWNLADELRRIAQNWDDIQVGSPTSPQLVMQAITRFCSEHIPQPHRSDGHHP